MESDNQTPRQRPRPILGNDSTGPGLNHSSIAGTNPSFRPPVNPRPVLAPIFQFIDEGEPGGNELNARRKRIRKHVMQEHMRQKRWQEKGRLDRVTLLQQRGFQIDTSQDLSSALSGSVPLLTFTPQPNSSEGIPPPSSAEEIEEIQRPRDGLLAPQVPLGGKIPDGIDALIANAVTKKTSFPTYFNLPPFSPSGEYRPSVLGPFSTAGTQLPTLHGSADAQRRGSTESNETETSTSQPENEDSEQASRLPGRGSQNSLTPIQTAVQQSTPRPVPVCLPDPCSAIGNSRKDPFSTLPLKLKEHEHALVDHFMRVMPFDYYGVRGRRDILFNWFRDVVYPTAMKNPISFRSAVLGFAASHKARLQKALTTSELSNQSTMALRALNAHFQKYPDDCSDEAIAMCLIQAVFEDFNPGLDRKANSWVHMRAAMRMIRNRGGPDAIRRSPRLTMLANCYDYRTPGYCGEGLSFSFQNYPSSMFGDLKSSDPAELGRAEVALVCEEFIDFVRSIEHLSLVQRSDSYAKMSPRRQQIFKPGSSIHSIIASPPAPRRSISGYQHQVTYGISVLIHLNAALWDFRRDPELSERFLKELSLRIVENELDTYVSVEALGQLMLRPTPDPDMRQAHFDRIWFVGRMVKVAKRLSLESWLRLRGMLIGYLTLEETPTFLEWEDDFRQEVLSAPLTSFIMPALMVSPDPGNGNPP